MVWAQGEGPGAVGRGYGGGEEGQSLQEEEAA